MASVKQALTKLNDLITVRDEDDSRAVDKWASPDILPVLPKNRTFTTAAYASYWVSGAVCASFWSMGGSAVAVGLTGGEAVGAIIVGSLICAIVAHFCGRPGTKYHLGFPIMSRATFGMYGSYIVVVVKCFTSFLYCGIQSYWGGLAVHVILASIFSSYRNMNNTLPQSANITTANLIGMVIYMVLFMGILLIPPYKMQKFFMVSLVGVIMTIFGMFIWAMIANHGAGNLVSPSVSMSTSETGLAFIQIICTLCGSFTGASVRHSDWSRYAKNPNSPMLGIWVVGPLALTLTAMFGVFVTSAAKSMYGEVIWQPITLLLYIQQVNYSPSARAGTFFAGVGWLMSQLAVNVSLNSVACGMDLTSVAPRYLNARRGGLLLAVIGFVVCPWNYVNSASTFTTVLSAFGLFIAPLIGIYIADFWLIRHTNWKVPDLYLGTKQSAYWYNGGFHIRAFSAWFAILWVSLPGFAMEINPHLKLGNSWKRIFQITFFVGLFGGFVIYYVICLVFPIPSARIHEAYDEANDISVIDGVETYGQKYPSVSDHEKGLST